MEVVSREVKEALEKFPRQEGEDQYYLYTLHDPTVAGALLPFSHICPVVDRHTRFQMFLASLIYIGHGKGKRDSQHLNLNLPYIKGSNPCKFDRIKALRAAGSEVVIHRVADGLTKDQAKYIEAIALRATRLGGNLREEKVRLARGSTAMLPFAQQLAGTMVLWEASKSLGWEVPTMVEVPRVERKVVKPFSNLVERTPIPTCALCHKYKHRSVTNVRKHIEWKHYPNNLYLHCTWCGAPSSTSQHLSKHMGRCTGPSEPGDRRKAGKMMFSREDDLRIIQAVAMIQPKGSYVYSIQLYQTIKDMLAIPNDSAHLKRRFLYVILKKIHKYNLSMETRRSILDALTQPSTKQRKGSLLNIINSGRQALANSIQNTMNNSS